MDIIEELLKLKKEYFNKIEFCKELDVIKKLKTSLLGKKGEITCILRNLTQIKTEKRKEIGKAVNLFKQELIQKIDKKVKEIEKSNREHFLEKEEIDVTQPGKKIELGHLHPITLVLREVSSLFSSMGFEIVEDVEIEDEYHNFEALNILKDHPARDMWDTFYLKNGYIPRTHTSSVQIRVMKRKKPPLRIIAPGRCYRYEAIDATHLPVFNQVEGLVVDKNIRLSDLKGTLEECVKHLLGEGLKTRLRPAFYPFVEPGLDLDVECIFCHRKGCSLCKNTGWIEVIPCGMVHPQVFKNVGYDPNKVTGFAFGMGFDRMVMLKYGINDLRLLYQGNLEMLYQF